MNSHKNYSLKLVAVLVLVAFALVPQVRAQQSSAFNGKFRLSEPVNWQGKILPPGEYTFSVTSTSFPARLILRGPKGTVVIVASGQSDGFRLRNSTLTIELRGGTHFVRELFLNNPPMAFRYWVPSIPKNEPRQQALTAKLVAITSTAE
jgi:hypothetical protein